jgi:hypothetical protein
MREEGRDRGRESEGGRERKAKGERKERRSAVV